MKPLKLPPQRPVFNMLMDRSNELNKKTEEGKMTKKKGNIEDLVVGKIYKTYFDADYYYLGRTIKGDRYLFEKVNSDGKEVYSETLDNVVYLFFTDFEERQL